MDDQSLKHFYDAREAARAISRFAAGRGFQEYCADEMLSSAIERKFAIIGEALNRIRRSRPEDLNVIGEWPAIIGFRNILAHAYDHVEDALVWGIVTEQLPRFIRELDAIPGIDLDERGDL
ncbi:MAG: DUF86 domain-containing protein [Candidatus Hydrogenedentes bacterium]|nr:DUF86 domain-containing protein [Candidatus Hydrogenedentota bacterium]